MSLLRQGRILLFAAGLVGVAVFVTVTSATNSWGGYHWARTTSQFTLKLGDNLSNNTWRFHLGQASQDWNSPPTGSTPLLTAVVAGQSKRNCSAVTGTTQVCNGKYGNNGWLGLATIYITDGVHITKGSAKMNDTYFNLSTYNNSNERQHVICQEVAHTFGLDHQSEDGSSQNSCMDYFSNTGANAGSTLSTKPNQHDFDELNIIYGHVDNTTTVAQSTSSSAGVELGDNDDPNSWGVLVSQSRNGRSSTYERSNPDGSKTVRHVYWTLDAVSNCSACDHRFDNNR
jgi:hypothetical protein